MRKFRVAVREVFLKPLMGIRGTLMVKVKKFTGESFTSMVYQPVPFKSPEIFMYSQGGIALAGGKLKEDGLYHFFIINTGGTNSSGFTSLPTGQRFTTGAFSFINKSVQYWTTTSGAAPATDVYYGGTSYSSGSATNGQFYKSTGIAVRCLKD